ncbi:AraC family transcriptional regulator [Streptomyces kanasensis]|uniref:AraC family transcriptional regulator n=1 Tax=Streptomyces kanasensis TaxID=936756 RepID=UPI00381E95BF
MLSYTGYRLHQAPPLHKLSIPATTVTLVLSWGNPIRVLTAHDQLVTGTCWHAALVGLHTAAVTTETGGTAQGVQVEMTPLGAYSLLGIPLRHISDTMIEPADVLGQRWVARLVGRLAGATDWPARWAALNEALTHRLSEGPAPSPVTVEAWHRLCASKGTMPVAELARATGRSSRRLESLFREQIGLPPKQLARIVRFQHAITRPPRAGLTWAETAAACGYHDQAHMAREFRALTGLTATRFHSSAARAGDTTATPVHGRITALRIR